MGALEGNDAIQALCVLNEPDVVNSFKCVLLCLRNEIPARHVLGDDLLHCLILARNPGLLPFVGSPSQIGEVVGKIEGLVLCHMLAMKLQMGEALNVVHHVMKGDVSRPALIHMLGQVWPSRSRPIPQRFEDNPVLTTLDRLDTIIETIEALHLPWIVATPFRQAIATFCTLTWLLHSREHASMHAHAHLQGKTMPFITAELLGILLPMQRQRGHPWMTESHEDRRNIRLPQ